MMLNPYVPLKEKLSQPRIAAEEPRGAAGEESMLWNRFEADVDNLKSDLMKDLPLVLYIPSKHEEQLASLIESLDSHGSVFAQSVEEGSIFLNEFAFFISVLLGAVPTISPLPLLRAYLVSIAPFVHFFTHLQFELKLNFSDLFAGDQAVLGELVKIHPRYTNRRWSLRMPHEALQAGRFALPMLVSGDFTDDILEATQEACRALDSARGLEETGQGIHALVALIQRLPEDTLCDTLVTTLAPILGELSVLVPSALRGQMTSALVRNCKQHIPLSIRLDLLKLPYYEESTSIWVPEYDEDDGLALLNRIALLPVTRLVGKLNFLQYGDITAGPLEEGIREFLKLAVRNLFSVNSQIFLLDSQHGYAPHPAASPDTLEAAGRLIGLYFREGNFENELGQYSQNLALFLNFHSVRRGFYQVFPLNSFEFLFSAHELEELFENAEGPSLIVSIQDSP